VENSVEEVFPGAEIRNETSPSTSWCLVRNSYIQFAAKIFSYINPRRFILTRLPELRNLNQGTFFAVNQIHDSFNTKSACHVIYGDSKFQFC
jgi:hypothetical protein